MPSKYIVKEYVEGGIYHVYNRGVEKRDIFIDEQDYNFFIFLIKSYVLPPDLQKENSETRMQKSAFVGRIEILSYALMSNHYHLLIQQTNEHDLAEFMKALMTSYVSYFNKKYERTGHLFQDHYKAILVKGDDYLLHLSRYIHLNPVATRCHLVEEGEVQGATLSDEMERAHTSYREYLQPTTLGCVNTLIILGYFDRYGNSQIDQIKEYQKFVESSIVNEADYLGIYSID